MSAHNDEVSKLKQAWWNLKDSISNIRFFKFNWMSKKFFIRSFILLILIQQIIATYVMWKTQKFDYGVVFGNVMVAISLLGIAKFEKIALLKNLTKIDKNIKK